MAEAARASRSLSTSSIWLPVDEQHVVGEPVAVRHLELADGDTAPGGEVQLVPVLDEPPGGVQGLVNLDAGLLLW